MRPLRARTLTLDTRHSSRRRGAAGVTLVEVVIAIFILTVGVLGIIALVPTGYRLGQRAFDRSVAALAARDALPRLMAELKRTPIPAVKHPTSSQSLHNIAERDRIGTISAVDAITKLRCKTRGGTTNPNYASPSTVNYYLVMTSGAASGKLYRITGAGGNQLTCSSAKFRTSSGKSGDPIRVGDHYAIIGSTSPAASKCFPITFLTQGASNRTHECATHGNRRPHREQSGNPPWEYSYGCVLSAPSKEMEKLHRVDVFVYRAFDPSQPVDRQQRPAGHFVTYVSYFDDYANP